MLFLRAGCPYIPLERTAVGDIFRKRMREAGLPDCAKHVYRLRHTFAMRLLRRGVGMKAIGDVLGHHSSWAPVLTCGSTPTCYGASLLQSPAGREGTMRKVVPLHRFDAAVEAFLSSRRALERALRLDEYALHHLRAHLARARRSDLDGQGFASWRRRLRHCAHNTRIDWAAIVYRFCRYRRRGERRCFLPQRWMLGRCRLTALRGSEHNVTSCL